MSSKLPTPQAIAKRTELSSHAVLAFLIASATMACSKKNDGPEGVRRAQTITAAGTIIAAITDPLGGGNHDLEVIRDGDKPPVGNDESSRQYDTATGDPNRAEDWIGYEFLSEVPFTGLLFQEGKHFEDGGWFQTLTVQVRQGGTWVDVPNVTTTPPYPGVDNGVSYESFQFDFAPVTGDAIRIHGQPGGSIRFISVGELEVFGDPPAADPDPAGPHGLRASYYKGTGHQWLALERTDSNVDFDWEDGSPSAEVPPDEFSVRWKGKVQPRYSGLYTFTTESDDGMRLTVDGQVLVEDWNLHATEERSGSIELTAGVQYDIELEYFEQGFAAVARLKWQSPFEAKHIIPASRLLPGPAPPPADPDPAGPHGLWAEYFGDVTLNSSVHARIESKIDADWGHSAPVPEADSESFSARWTGMVQPRYSGLYRFIAEGDDGVRLWVNGQLLIDGWQEQLPTEYQGTIQLTAGTPYVLKMEFFEHTGGAVARLSWESDRQIREIIPASRLLPGEPPAAPPWGRDLTSAGAPIAKIVAPGGGGGSLSVISDRDTPPVGENAPWRQYDTFTGDMTRMEDWIGYQFFGTTTFSRVVFQEGMHFPDGGWFETLSVQVRQGSSWVTIPNPEITPAYPGTDNGTGFETYVIDFPATSGDAIRIHGQPGGSMRFISVGELRVYGTAATTLNGPVATYGFEDGTGTTAADSSGHNLEGTLTGAAWAGGRFGQALAFDGTDDVVTVGDDDALDLTAGMTLSAWVYPTAPLTEWPAILVKENGSGLAYALQANSNQARPGASFSANGTLQTVTGGPLLPQNQWRHLTTTYNGSKLSFYVDGVLVGIRNAAPSIDVSSDPLRIGGGAGHHFAGRIDEVRIYNRPLAPAEVIADMNAPVVPGTPSNGSPGSGMPPGGAAPGLNALVLYTGSGGWLFANTISGGAVGARQGTLALTDGTNVESSRPLYASTVSLDGASTVGSVLADQLNVTSGSFTNRGPFPPGMPELPAVSAVNAGTELLTVPAGTTVSLAATSAYDTVIVEEGAILRLTGGVYEVNEIDLMAGGRLEVEAPVDLRLARSLVGAGGVYVGPAPGTNLTAKDLKIQSPAVAYSFPHHAVDMADGELRALVLAPNGKVYLHADSEFQFRGAIVAGVVWLSRAVMAFEDGFPGDAPQPCDDGNVCNGLEVCDANGTHPGVPPAMDDSNPCTVDSCHPVTGVQHLPVDNGSACSDGNACTTIDTCQSGVCVGGAAVVCLAQDQCHDPGTCAPATGACTHPTKENGSICGDSNLCNGTDSCQAGVCTNTPPPALDDGNGCTVDSCDPIAGFSHVAMAEGAVCNAGDVCSGVARATCQNSACVADPPPAQHTEVIPTGSAGFRYKIYPTGTVPTNYGTEAFDDSAFPVGEAPFASPGGCAVNVRGRTHWPIFSELVLRKRVVVPANATALRVTIEIDNDLEVFFNETSLTNGFIRHYGCAEANWRQFDITGSLLRPGENLIAIRAGDFGSQAAVDVKFTLTVPGADPRDDGNPCTIDLCNAVSGVSHVAVADGTPCADANACNGVEVCNFGICQAGVPVNISDGNACSVDSCDPTSGGVTHTLAAHPRDGLVSWWPGDGNANDVRDGNNGILQQGAGFTPGKVSQAISLDGTNDFVDAGNATNLKLAAGSFSVDGWFRFRSLTRPTGVGTAPIGDMAMVDKMSPTGTNTDGWRLFKQNGNRFWFCLGRAGGNGCVNGSSTTVQSTTVLDAQSLNKWYHVAVVKEANKVYIYVNGTLEVAQSVTLPYNETGVANLVLGNNIRDGAFLSGDIDEVEIFNRALSQAEVTAIYRAGSEGACKPNASMMNEPPAVNAGVDATVLLPPGPGSTAKVALIGSLSDDGFPTGALSGEWSMVSGPSQVTFDNASAAGTAATLTAVGTYVLRLTATDGVLSVGDNVMVHVVPLPSLEGATLTASVDPAGPFPVGTNATVTATLIDASAQPIANFPINVSTSGPHTVSATIFTDADGQVDFTYSGSLEGTDTVEAVAMGMTSTQTATASVVWFAPSNNTNHLTQGWIGSPLHQSVVNGVVPIVLGPGITLASGSIDFWSMSDSANVRVLAAAASGGPGSTLATFDTTTLANGPYIIRLVGLDSMGRTQGNLVAVTVSGDYKPGRVVTTVTDFTVPLAGLPITIARTYDSLESGRVGDFGHGWSLSIGHPRLEVDPAHNVTVTLPGGRRATFFFGATEIPFLGGLFLPGYAPAPGVFGRMTSDGCDLVVPAAGKVLCFPGASGYSPTTFTYTDPVGNVLVMGITGELRSIKDLHGNKLTFSAAGITSSAAGATVAFVRDGLGRISQIADLNGALYKYQYDVAGNLNKMTDPRNGNHQYTYDAQHLLLTAIDPNGGTPLTATYDAKGRLATSRDARSFLTSYAYDVAARTTTITAPDQGVTVLEHDAKGDLLAETDPLGRRRTQQYNASRLKVAETNAAGETTQYTYNVNGQETSRTDAAGRTWQTAYNSVGQIARTEDPSGRWLEIAYATTFAPSSFADNLGTLATFTSSPQGLPLTITDASGATVRLTYDARGNLLSRQDRLGRTTSYTYDFMGRTVKITDPRGGSTSFARTSLGQVARSTHSTGDTRTLTYDAVGNSIRESDARGAFTETGYDFNNYVRYLRDKDGTGRFFTRNFRGAVLTALDPRGDTTNEYDKAGQLLKTTHEDRAFTTKTYDLLGRVVTTTDERGGITRYEYESGCGCSDRVTKVTDPLGRATHNAYDAGGRRVSTVDPAGRQTTFGYDIRGRQLSVTYPDGTVRRSTYDALGRVTSEIDQAGVTTQFGYDAEGQLLSVTDGLGKVTRYEYGPGGEITRTIDANGHVTIQVYDRAGRLEKRTLPLGMSESFNYDLRGDKISRLDFRGKRTSYTHDGVGRILTITPDPTLGEPSVSFEYSSGLLTEMTDGSGVTEYTYDNRGRLTTKATPAGTLTYNYDATSNVSRIRSSNTNGVDVSYSWDADGQLTAVTDNRVPGGMTVAGYGPTGRPTEITHPVGLRSHYAYDALDRLTTIAYTGSTSSSLMASYVHALNSTGRHLSTTDLAGRKASYSYDAGYRLTGEGVTGEANPTQNGMITYEVDSVGNRVSRSSTVSALPSATYVYDANDRLLTDDHDTNGNMVLRNGAAYAYDFNGRLKSKNGDEVTIVYDGDGVRAAKTVGAVTTRYLTDDINPSGYSQVMEEVEGGVVRRRYTHGSMLVSQSQFVAGGFETTYYGYDGKGNVTFLADSSGAITDKYTYDAFGSLIAWTGDTANSYLYRGQEFDSDLGLYVLRARHYDPNKGRFLSLDPFEGRTRNPISLNKYLYAHGDPVNLYDPSGNEAAAGYGAIGLRVAAAVAVMPWTARLGWDGGQTEVNTVVVHAIGLQIACAFITASNGVANLMIASTGSNNIAGGVPGIYQHCKLPLKAVPFPETGPLPFPITAPTKGDCPDGLRFELHQAVEEFCKDRIPGKPRGTGPGSTCKRATTCPEVAKIIDINLKCLYARERITKQCFKDMPDSGHKTAVNDTLNRLLGCEKMEMKLGCR